jgi:molybdate transport system substrate-binding protein
MTTRAARPLLLAAALALPLPAAGEPVLTVFAASDLAFAFQELQPRFERAHGAKVTLVLGSTGNLGRQIEHGAPADVFFGADERVVDDLVARGVLIAETRTLYAQGRLVLATARSAGAKLGDLRELLDARVRRVAIANPAHAPYGRAAEEALRRLGIWERLRGKLVYGENIRQTLQFVQTGAVEAGLVALAVASVPELLWVPIDPGLHAPLNQAVAVVRRSRRPELGLALVQFVNGAEGRAILKRYGFVVAGEF